MAAAPRKNAAARSAGRSRPVLAVVGIAAGAALPPQTPTLTERQRIDVWLWRVRLAKSRALAAALIAAGNVRVAHNGQTRRLEKPSAEIEPGDALVMAGPQGVRALKVKALPIRRGPPREAAGHYAELDDGESLA